jgi:hypothetical protein
MGVLVMGPASLGLARFSAPQAENDASGSQPTEALDSLDLPATS